MISLHLNTGMSELNLYEIKMLMCLRY